MSPDKPAQEDLVGEVLEGAYRIERLLGAGGMAKVFEATHLRLGRRVAVKVMARELAANAEALARFHREAMVTSGLGHPHIVQVVDFSTTAKGEPFLVMEFLEGEDLDRRLAKVGRLPAAKVVTIVKQVASALTATHGKAIVHRDLKPANIYLVDAAGETDFVKVVDFGVSKVLSATTQLTRVSSIVGTTNYMSPEQANGANDEIDDATDQWALACIAWECLAGEGPFEGDSVPSILYRVVHAPPPSLLAKVPGLHPRVEDVLLHALSKNKRDRFATVSDFARALEDAVTGTSSGTLPATPRTADLPPASRSADHSRSTTFTQGAGEIASPHGASHSRRKWRVGLVVMAVVIALAAALLAFRPGSSRTPTSRLPVPHVPAAPAPTAAPPPTAERPVVPPAEVTTSPPVSPAQRTQPDPEAKPAKPRPARQAAPAAAARSDERRPTAKPRLPQKPREENQQIWRVD
jgi:serine/threonine protein kinase